MGSTMLGGGAAMAGGSAAMPAVGAVANMFEGGEVSLATQVKGFRVKYKNSMKAPLTPTINAIIGMFYLKILMGGIVNTQNADLLQAKNFGPNGILSAGDQFSVIFGYCGLVGALIIFIMLTVNLMVHVPWMFDFGKKVIGTEFILTRTANHKWFMFTMGQMKTFITIYIIVFYATANFTVPQLLMTLIINPANLLIAWKLKPLPKFYCIDLTDLAKAIDVLAMFTCYMQLSMTDLNRDPTVPFKINIGYAILIAGQAKFYLGNFNLSAQMYLLHQKKIEFVKQTFCCCLYGKKTIAKSDTQEFFDNSRRQLVD